MTLVARARAGDLRSEEKQDIPVLPAGPRVRSVQRIELQQGEYEVSPRLRGWLPLTERTTLWVTANPYGEAFGHLRELMHYPYGCIEQTTSTTRPLLYVSHLVGSLDPSFAGPGKVEQMVQAGIERILSMQTPSGGFGYWPGDSEPTPWGSAYATHILLDAQRLRYPVPQGRIDDALQWMEQRISNHYERGGKDYDWHAKTSEPYMHYVLALAGKGRKGRVLRLIEQLPAQPQHEEREQLYMLKAALYLAGDHRYERDLRHPDVSPLDGYRENYWTFYSDLRMRGFMLSVFTDLFGNDPGAERLAALVAQGLQNTKPNHWYTTQELAWGITGLGKTLEAGAQDFAPPTLVADGRQLQPVTLPPGVKRSDRTWDLPRAGEYERLTMTVPRKGEGKLFLILVSEGVREEDGAPYGGEGLQLERRWLDAQGNALGTSTGAGTSAPAGVKLGELVYVELTLHNTSGERMSNIALVDRIPAGWEIENPRLGRSDATPEWVDEDRLWQADHLDLRDDRLEVFGELQKAEIRQIVYAVRAVTAGKFQLPTADAEAMYDPRNWARVRGRRSRRRGPVALTTRSRRRVVLAAALLAAAGVPLALVWLVPLPARLSVPPSTVVAYADGSPAYVFLSPDDKVRMRADLDAVDPDYLRALVRFEDKRFWAHPGVDPAALVRAAWLNVRGGRRVSGGSTLTMQLARVLEPRPRTLRSKVVEALRAVQLEARLGKRDILAAYLTFAPYGGNLEGVEAACWAYFGHAARDLVPEEIAVLLAVPQQPGARAPSPRNAQRLAAARAKVAARLVAAEALQAEGSDPATWAEVPSRLRPLPRHAPHAAFWLRARHPDRERIDTTLDRGAQLLAERAMARAQPEMTRLGIHNGAVVIADHESGEVRALVGNFDFWDGEHGGQIAGFDVARSPGSALKPLVFALGIDRGLALPEHLVPDVPVAYGNYTPQNFDGRFAGLVSLDDALSLSLNVPFVHLLDRIGLESFLGTLRSAGFHHLKGEPGFYGLSAAIGAVDVTPLEMAGLYAALAEDGRWRPLRVVATPNERSAAPAREAAHGEMRRVAARDDDELPHLVSPAAAWLTRRTLARRDRPDFPERRKWSGAPAHVHWKTGTSYGHRDAWAVGSGSRYTAAVWLGNFDNTGAFDLVGADAAGPILFDLLETMEPRRLPSPHAAPAGLEWLNVCAYSGYLPGAACPTRKRVLAVRTAVPTRRCPYHVAVDVDLASGLALQPGCRGERRWETRSYVTWPASLRRWLGEHHRWLPEPPPLAPGCEAPPEPGELRILSPPQGQVLVLLPGVSPERQEVPLQAEVGGGSALSWFIDGEYLGSAPADERLWWQPVAGRHRIVVVDAAGRTAMRELQVREGLAGGALASDAAPAGR